MKKIYRITLDGDFGEVWFDESLHPISWVDGTHFGKDDYEFLIKYLGGELIDLDLKLSQYEYKKIENHLGNLPEVAKIIIGKLKEEVADLDR